MRKWNLFDRKMGVFDRAKNTIGVWKNHLSKGAGHEGLKRIEKKKRSGTYSNPCGLRTQIKGNVSKKKDLHMGNKKNPTKS